MLGGLNVLFFSDMVALLTVILTLLLDGLQWCRGSGNLKLQHIKRAEIRNGCFVLFECCVLECFYFIYLLSIFILIIFYFLKIFINTIHFIVFIISFFIIFLFLFL